MADDHPPRFHEAGSKGGAGNAESARHEASINQNVESRKGEKMKTELTELQKTVLKIVGKAKKPAHLLGVSLGDVIEIDHSKN